MPVRTRRAKPSGSRSASTSRRAPSPRGHRALSEMTTQGAVALQSPQYIEQIERSGSRRRLSRAVPDIDSEVTSTCRTCSSASSSEATDMLNAERATMFLNDGVGELWSREWSPAARSARSASRTTSASPAPCSTPARHQHSVRLRRPALQSVVRQADRASSRARSCACRSSTSAADHRRHPGAQQARRDLHRRRRARLKAFTAQISIALENAKLFADVQNMKNYNESMLEIMSSGVMTLDETAKIVTCNAAGLGASSGARRADPRRQPGGGVLQRAERLDPREIVEARR